MYKILFQYNIFLKDNERLPITGEYTCVRTTVILYALITYCYFRIEDLEFRWTHRPDFHTLSEQYSFLTVMGVAPILKTYGCILPLF